MIGWVTKKLFILVTALLCGSCLPMQGVSVSDAELCIQMDGQTEWTCS